MPPPHHKHHKHHKHARAAARGGVGVGLFGAPLSLPCSVTFHSRPSRTRTHAHTQHHTPSRSIAYVDWMVVLVTDACNPIACPVDVMVT